MALRLTTLVLAISVVILPPTAGQARPDFSGRWRATGGGSADVPSGVGPEFTVTQTANRLTIAIAGLSWAREFDLDGVGREYTMAMGPHTSAKEFRMAKWSGSQLMLRNLSGQDEWTATWVLDAKGTLMIASTDNSGSEPRRRKMSFTRADGK